MSAPAWSPRLVRRRMDRRRRLGAHSRRADVASPAPPSALTGRCRDRRDVDAQRGAPERDGRPRRMCPVPSNAILRDAVITALPSGPKRSRLAEVGDWKRTLDLVNAGLRVTADEHTAHALIIASAERHSPAHAAARNSRQPGQPGQIRAARFARGLDMSITRIAAPAQPKSSCTRATESRSHSR